EVTLVPGGRGGPPPPPPPKQPPTPPPNAPHRSPINNKHKEPKKVQIKYLHTTQQNKNKLKKKNTLQKNHRSN
ncbi:hypothetical protein ACVGW0_14630, partial [Enterobacter intestinihominis]